MFSYGIELIYMMLLNGEKGVERPIKSSFVHQMLSW